MPARRRYVVGPEVDRDYEVTASSRSEGSQPFYHRYHRDDNDDEDSVSGRQPLTETVVGDAKLTRDIDAAPKMTSRDRTNEFANAIRSIQSSNAVRVAAANLQNPRQSHQLQNYSSFMLAAKNISKNIASTYTKLEKLALCKI